MRFRISKVVGVQRVIRVTYRREVSLLGLGVDRVLADLLVSLPENAQESVPRSQIRQQLRTHLNMSSMSSDEMSSSRNLANCLRNLSSSSSAEKQRRQSAERTLLLHNAEHPTRRWHRRKCSVDRRRAVKCSEVENGPSSDSMNSETCPP